MIQLQSIGLNNIVYFKKAHITIEPGLHVIRGLNLNSANCSQNNGAGKSLLFSPLPNVLYGSPPISAKKKAKKDLLGTNSCASLEFLSHDKRHIKIEQYATKYNIFENSVDLKIETSTKAETFIRDIFPLNVEEFYSTVYLTSMIPLSFQYYSPADRLKYISSLFRLNDYDTLRSHFSTKMREIKDCETEYRTLQLEQQKYYKQLEQKTFTLDDQKQLDSCNERIESYKASLSDIQEMLLKYSKMGIVHNQLKKLKLISKDYTVSIVKQKLKKLHKIKEDYAAYDDYCIQYKAYKRSVASIRNEYDAIDVDGTLKEHSLQLTFFESKLQECKENLDKACEQERDYKKYIEKYKMYTRDLKEYDFEILDEDVTEYIVHAKSLLKLKSLISDHNDCVTCPTCNTSLDTKNLKRIVKGAQKDYDKFKAMFEAQQIKMKLQELVEPEYDKKSHEFFCSEYSNTDKQVKEILQKIKMHKAKLYYKEALDAISKPECIDEPEYDRQEVDTLYSENVNILDALKRIQILLDEHEYDENYDTEKEELLRSQYSRLSAKLDTVHSKSRKLDTAKTEHNLLYQNKFEVESKLASLQETLDRKRIIEALVSAYGSKGLKINAINNIVQTLEESLNNFAKFIFNEKFSFELSTDSNGINAIVHRKNGIMSDVRNLSGAESDCFRLLFLVSLLPMIPNDRRTNFIVLDEPDSHCDPVSREKFICDFVPHLCSIIPSVYILTPNDDNYIDANNLLVVKEKGVSKLILDSRLK